ncbi:MAG: glycosyl hydrolase family 28-related protein [Candidatus Micrarchaeaceae archaeon]
MNRKLLRHSFVIFSILILVALVLVSNHINAMQHSNPAIYQPSGNTTSTPIIPANRLINWSQAGIPGGIPSNYTLCANVKDPPYNAKGDGVSNDTSAIQNAIFACPNDTIVYMPPGNYLVSFLIINRSVALMGAGTSNTNLIFSSKNLYIGSYNFYDGNVDVLGSKVGPPPSIVNWTGGFQKGDYNITLNSTSGLHVGELIMLDELNDSSFVNSAGDEPYSWEYCSRNETSWYGAASGINGTGGFSRCAPQIDVVKSINAAADSITLEIPVYYTHLASLNPQVAWSKAPQVSYAGVENMSMHLKGQIGGITTFWCKYCWVSNISIYNSTYYAVEFSTMTYGNEFLNSLVFKALPYPCSSEHYSVEMSTTSADLIEDNIFDQDCTPIVTAPGVGGVVIAYNYMVNSTQWNASQGYYAVPSSEIAMHAVPSIYMLIEGNVGYDVDLDNIHGSHAWDTVFRNKLSGYVFGRSNYGQQPIEIEAHNLYDNVLGNILGTFGVDTVYQSPIGQAFSYFDYVYVLGYWIKPDNLSQYDYNVPDTLIRQGNWDTASNAAVWNPSIPNQSIPASLYLTSKPSWWGNLTWPAFGPSPSNPDILLNGEIPAEVRYDKMMNITLEQPTGSPLAVGTPTPYNQSIIIGNSITLTAHASGGTPPYSYAWYYGPDSECHNNILKYSFSTSSSSYIFTPNATYYYCYQVFDSASPGTLSNYSQPTKVAVTNGPTTTSTSQTTTSTSTRSTSVTTTSTSYITTTIPQGSIFAYVPIVITNAQSKPTPQPFQMMITVNSMQYSSYEAQNLDNIEFFYPNFTNIPSWLQSGNSNSSTNTIYWLKLNISIAANSNAIVYMGFAGHRANLFGNTGIGESPNLSSKYGQYDDGQEVFDFYDNFAGTTLDTSKWQTIQNGGTITANNGLLINVTAYPEQVAVFSKSTFAYPTIAEAYLTGIGGGISPWVGVSTTMNIISGNGQPPTNSYLIFENYPKLGYEPSWYATNSISTVSINQFPITGFGPGVETVAWIATGNEYFADGLGNKVSATDSTLTIVYYHLTIGSWVYETTADFQWARIRTYPPNGVLPSATFEPIKGNSSITITSTTSASTTSLTTTTSVSSTSATTTSGSTTIVSGAGGGGGGPSGGGAGGSEKPVIIPISNGYIITNIASLDSFNVSLCNEDINIVDNFLTPSYSGLTVNGRQYTLSQGIPELAFEDNGESCYALLLNTSYLPIQHTITLEIYTNKTMPLIINSIYKISGRNPTVVNATKINATFYLSMAQTITTPSFTYINLYVSNANASSNSIPKGYNRIKIFNASLYGIQQVYANISIAYNYSKYSNNVVPFRLSNRTNNTWSRINSYSISSGRINVYNHSGIGLIGLFAPENSSASAETITTSATTSLIIATTVYTTTIPQVLSKPRIAYFWVVIITGIIAASILSIGYLIHRIYGKHVASKLQQQEQQPKEGQVPKDGPAQPGTETPPQG